MFWGGSKREGSGCPPKCVVKHAYAGESGEDSSRLHLAEGSETKLDPVDENRLVNRFSTNTHTTTESDSDGLESPVQH